MAFCIDPWDPHCAELGNPLRILIATIDSNIAMLSTDVLAASSSFMWASFEFGLFCSHADLELIRPASSITLSIKLIPIPSPGEEDITPKPAVQVPVPVPATVQVSVPVPNSVPIPVKQIPLPEIEEVEPAVSDEVEIIEITPQVPVPEAVRVEDAPEIATSVFELEDRIAEIDSLCRDFLLVGTVDDEEDVRAFISSLSEYGLTVVDQNSVNFVKTRLMTLDAMAKAEKDAIHSMPNSWREREALRRFEDARGILRDALPEIISFHDGEMVKARMAFEEKARSMGLDLRLPAVSGRLHALFDLQVSLDMEIA